MPLGSTFFEWTIAKILGKNIIFDFDDAIWKLDTSNENKSFEWLKNPEKTKRIIQLSSLIIAGNEYLNPKTVQEFTRQQYSKNRRGAGFDRPKINGGGTCDERCSQKSFGHSGFTGTLAWADPVNEVIVIFLSNRVYPDAQNWKLLKLNIRTDIQHEVYDLLESSKN